MESIIKFLTGGGKPENKAERKLLAYKLLTDSKLSKQEGSPSILKEIKSLKAKK